MSSLSDDTTWAVHECAEAELGDLRRTQRLRELATVLAQNPRASWPEASGNSAMRKAAYRFFANEAIAPHDIIQSHIEATYGRLDTVPVV
jgi:Transposase DNA-binding